jgi:hypothetical protein
MARQLVGDESHDSGTCRPGFQWMTKDIIVPGPQWNLDAQY